MTGGSNSSLAATLAACLVSAGAVMAQQPVAPPSRLLVFADTNSVRVEYTRHDAAGLSGASVAATIVAEQGGAVLWKGQLGNFTVLSDSSAQLTATIGGLAAQRWNPQTPVLYRLTLFDAHDAPIGTARFGFRRLTTRNGLLYLNGRQIFLRGNAINPPDRNLPDSLSENPRFARDYLRYMKGIGVNIIRLTRPSPVWMDAADEVGMMIYQGHYGTPKGGTSTSPPKDFGAALRWYRDDVLAPQVNHPSVVIYTLANEQAAKEIPYLTRGADEVNRFLTQLHDTLSKWDDSRLYIGNAGYGFGRAGEICDIHRYWGWYYNSIFSFYTLRDPRVCWRTDTPQPITLTENTGNYTAPDGRFNLVSGTKQPESQLNWTGHAPDSEQSARALAYQAFVARNAIEITRRLRERNSHLAGLMPFTILFRDWAGIMDFAGMHPKPIADQYRTSYSPVLLSWELWTPQVYAGNTFTPVVHVVNDSDAGTALRNLRLRWALAPSDSAQPIARGELTLGDVSYFAATSTPLPITLPANTTTGAYRLAGALVSGTEEIAANVQDVFVAAPGFSRNIAVLHRRVVLYDPAGTTASALRRVNVPFTRVSSLDRLDPAHDALVIGARAWRKALPSRLVRAFVAAGGRALVLEQDARNFDTSWLPARVTLQTEPLDHALLYPDGRPYRNGMAVNPELPDHPVFDGIDRDRLFLWSDPTHWNETKPGFPVSYPVTDGFKFAGADDLAHATILADYDHGLEGVALAELREGQGSVLLNGFGIVARAGLDPVADRLLANLVRHVANDSTPARPLIDSKIVWGDYASERGLVTGIYSGLVLNTVPRVPATMNASDYPITIDSEGFAFAGSRGGWNTNPSIQYVARGRRPFGPYRFTLGGAVQLPKDHGPLGEGSFWLRLPSGRSTMTTTVENPTAAPLPFEVRVNAEPVQRTTIPAKSTAAVETPLAGSPTSLGVTYRGDRRLVILSTDFR